MIPKIVHYCWFGRGKKNRMVRACMLSWKKHLPDYEFREWNEDLFDVEALAYTAEAYRMRKYAFVADVARLHALYQFGGLYLDTDVEMLRSFDPFLVHRAVCGFESGCRLNTGLLAAQKGSEWVKQNLDRYADRHFILSGGAPDLTPNVDSIMAETALHVPIRYDDSYQDFPNYLTVYPRDYFSPMDWQTKVSELTPRTVCIHHYTASWKKRSGLCLRLMKRLMRFCSPLRAHLSNLWHKSR